MELMGWILVTLGFATLLSIVTTVNQINGKVDQIRDKLGLIHKSREE